MYLPPAFAEPDATRLWRLVAAYPFATLIAPGPAPGDAPEIAHVPLLADPDRGTLLGHVARANPMAARLDGGRVTAVFHGPHGYVSPRWYRSAGQVPTWNYAVVHARGAARHTDERTLRGVLARLAAAHETGDRPWRMGEVEPADLAEMLDAIVGFEIAVDALVGKLKLSQNRAPEDREGVRAALAARGGPGDLELLAWMPGEATEGAAARGPRPTPVDAADRG